MLEEIAKSEIDKEFSYENPWRTFSSLAIKQPVLNRAIGSLKEREKTQRENQTKAESNEIFDIYPAA